MNSFMELNYTIYYTPLIWATIGRRPEIVSLLLSQPGIDINFKDV